MVGETGQIKEISVAPRSFKPLNDALPAAREVMAHSMALVITDQATYEKSNVIAKLMKEKIKFLIEERKKFTDPLDAARRVAMDMFRKPIDAMTNEVNRQNQNVINFEQEQEKIRKAEEVKVRAAQEKKEFEARKKAEDDQKKAEEARTAGDEAVAMKHERSAAKQEEKADEAAVVPTTAPAIERPTGSSIAKNWKAEIVNPKLVPCDYLMPDQKKLDKQAKATENTLQIPGVRFYNKPKVIRKS